MKPFADSQCWLAIAVIGAVFSDSVTLSMAMRAPDSANETTTLVQLHAQRSQGVADDPMEGAIQRAITAFAGRLDDSECRLNGDVSWFADFFECHVTESCGETLNLKRYRGLWPWE